MQPAAKLIRMYEACQLGIRRTLQQASRLSSRRAFSWGETVETVVSKAAACMNQVLSVAGARVIAEKAQKGGDVSINARKNAGVYALLFSSGNTIVPRPLADSEQEEPKYDEWRPAP